MCDFADSEVRMRLLHCPLSGGALEWGPIATRFLVVRGLAIRRPGDPAPLFSVAATDSLVLPAKAVSRAVHPAGNMPMAPKRDSQQNKGNSIASTSLFELGQLWIFGFLVSSLGLAGWESV